MRGNLNPNSHQIQITNETKYYVLFLLTTYWIKDDRGTLWSDIRPNYLHMDVTLSNVLKKNWISNRQQSLPSISNQLYSRNRSGLHETCFFSVEPAQSWSEYHEFVQLFHSYLRLWEQTRKKCWLSVVTGDFVFGACVNCILNDTNLKLVSFKLQYLTEKNNSGSKVSNFSLFLNSEMTNPGLENFAIQNNWSEFANLIQEYEHL